ncbi:Stress-induced_protein sti1 [Hexamita inflata]|uniref:Stress-induced_protein sti1 n=1 Tax=Hexamita inflata TaxID=28002 RepID=A0ABP1HBD2_9EUKA
MSSDDLKNQGNAAAKAGDLPAAVKCYTEAIAIDPNNHVLYSNRSNIYGQQKNFQAALADAEKCIQINPKFGKGYVRKADALTGLNKPEEALQILDAGQKEDPNEPLIGQRRSSLVNDSQKQMVASVFGSSEQELYQKMNANPRIAAMMRTNPMLFNKCNAIRQSGDFISAMQSDQSLGAVIMELMGLGDMASKMPAQPGQPQHGQEEEIDGSSVQKPSCPGKCGDQCCKKTGGPCCGGKGHEQPKAEPKVAQEEPVSDEAKKGEELKNKGNEQFKQGQYEAAIALYEQAFEVHKNITYMNNISTALLKIEKYEEALKKAEEAYQYGKDNYGSASFQEFAKALAKQGSALYKLNRFEEAIQKLKDSMLEHRDKQTLQLLSKYEDEYREYKLKQTYNPEKALQCKNDGNALVKENKFVQAAEMFTEGIKMLPEKLQDGNSKMLYIQLHNNRSLALFKAGQIHASYDDAMYVLSNEPENIKAMLRKAQIERMRKQYYLSVESYQKLMQLDPSNAEAIEGFQKTALKINEMQSGQLTEAEMTEIANIAMADPNMQKIAQDPGLAQIIQQIQQNPSKSQQFMQDPMISKRLEKLINAGILRVGGVKQ